MADEDYYATLGVSRDASQDEINKAYRTLAKKWHPDVNKSPEATGMFEKITKAYEVLKDPKKRAAYDRFGAGAVDDGAGSAGFNPGNFSGFGQGFSGDDFGDIFSQFFGGGGRASRRQTGPAQGEDVLMAMRISFMDAVKGRTVAMPHEYETACPDCSGKGAVNPSDISTCSTCQGSGSVTTTQNTMFGRFQTRTTCPDCNGRGTKIVRPCSRCHGSGTVRVKETLHIVVPAGIDKGQRLRVPGKGGRGINGGPNGDLYIEMVIQPSDTYERDGLNLYSHAEVPLITAVLGGSIEVDTVWGRQTLDIKAGTQPGSTARMKGQGIHTREGRQGDQFVTLNIKIPTRLNQEEKELYAKLGQIAESRGEAKGVFSKIFNKKK